MPHRLFTSDVASLGWSLTLFLTFVGGSFSQTRFLRLRISGSAQRVCCFPTLPCNFPWYAVGSCSYPSCSDVVLEIWLFHPIAEGLGMSTWQVPFPAWKDIAFQVAFFFVYEDMFHFFGTQTLLLPTGEEALHPPVKSPSVPPLGPHVQAHPQNSPQILSSLRPCR